MILRTGYNSIPGPARRPWVDTCDPRCLQSWVCGITVNKRTQNHDCPPTFLCDVRKKMPRIYYTHTKRLPTAPPADCSVDATSGSWTLLCRLVQFQVVYVKMCECVYIWHHLCLREEVMGHCVHNLCVGSCKLPTFKLMSEYYDSVLYRLSRKGVNMWIALWFATVTLWQDISSAVFTRASEGTVRPHSKLQDTMSKIPLLRPAVASGQLYKLDGQWSPASFKHSPPQLQ